MIVFEVTREICAASELLQAHVALEASFRYPGFRQIVLALMLFETLEADGRIVATFDVALVSVLQIVIVQMFR